MRPTRPTRPPWGALAVVIAAAGLAGCSTRGEAPRTPPPPTVAVVEARRMAVPIEAEPIGTTAAIEQVSIRARVRGFLTEQHFEEGSDVKAGQLLFVIDEKPFQAQLDAANAQLAEAEAALARSQKSQAREVAQAKLDSDSAIAALAKVEERRQQLLRNRNANSQEDLDQATAVRKREDANVQGDAAALEQAKADYDVNIQAAEASVEGARAAVREAELNLGYCRMSSPIDGRVGQAKVKLGNLVGPSAGSQEYEELTTVQQLDPMGVNLEVSSRYLDRANRLIREGLPVSITRPVVEDVTDRDYTGEAYFIDNTIDPTTSTFLVKARVGNAEKTLLPGEYVKVRLVVGRVDDAVVVPERAVVETQAGSTVYMVGKDDTVAVVPVKATFTYRGLRVIESGLEPGARVIVDGLQLIRPGSQVKVEAAPVEESPGAAPAAPAPAPTETEPPPAAKSDAPAEAP